MLVSTVTSFSVTETDFQSTQINHNDTQYGAASRAGGGMAYEKWKLMFIFPLPLSVALYLALQRFVSAVFPMRGSLICVASSSFYLLCQCCFGVFEETSIIGVDESRFVATANWNRITKKKQKKFSNATRSFQKQIKILSIVVNKKTIERDNHIGSSLISVLIKNWLIANILQWQSNY